MWVLTGNKHLFRNTSSSGSRHDPMLSFFLTPSPRGSPIKGHRQRGRQHGVVALRDQRRTWLRYCTLPATSTVPHRHCTFPLPLTRMPSRIMRSEFTSCRSAGRCHLDTVTEKDWYEKARRPADLHELYPRRKTSTSLHRRNDGNGKIDAAKIAHAAGQFLCAY